MKNNKILNYLNNTISIDNEMYDCNKQALKMKNDLNLTNDETHSLSKNAIEQIIIDMNLNNDSFYKSLQNTNNLWELNNNYLNKLNLEIRKLIILQFLLSL